ncbi:MAG: formyl transferase [Candidatus Omnitrophica bacterium]|nr:formyl transferase [Candidatus Omnitrophota bacterium]
MLFLGGNFGEELSSWLKQQGEEVIYKEHRLMMDEIKQINPVFVISYNYKYLITKEIVRLFKGKIINLHISYLPWNRGYYPNVWSFLEDTPKGVTIHYIDEGIDTGDIIVQKEVFFDEDRETLKTSYDKLQKEIQELFKNNWERIKTGKIEPKRQPQTGSIHYKREFKIFEPFIREKGWDTPIRELKEKFMDYKKQIP